METLKISFFGPFSMSVGKHTLSEEHARGNKQWRLIKYLILNRHRALQKRELIDVVFGYGAYLQRSEAALNALNATVHRARILLSTLSSEAKEIICYSNGTYRAVLPENCEIDCELFDLLSEKAFSSGNLSEIKTYLLKISEIYKGFFLDKGFYEEWARVLAEKYHANYKRAFSMLCALLYSEKDFKTIAVISERASAIDTVCEDFRYERIRALCEAGESERAYEIYRNTLLLFEHSLSLPISEKFRDLGNRISGAEGGASKILSAISSHKRKFTVVPTSLFEEYATFTATLVRKTGDSSLFLAEIKLREPFSESDIARVGRTLENHVEFALLSQSKSAGSEKTLYLLVGLREGGKKDINDVITPVFDKNTVKISVFSV